MITNFSKSNPTGNSNEHLEHKKPLLHVVIITYNRFAELNRTIHSMLPILDLNCAITILDNASDDQTPSICAEVKREHPKIEIIRNKFNIGLGGNLLRALEISRGEYTWVVGDDDLIFSDQLSVIVNELSRNNADIYLLSKRGATTVSRVGPQEISRLENNGLLYYKVTNWITNVIFRSSYLCDKVIYSCYKLCGTLFPQLPLFDFIRKKNGLLYIFDKPVVEHRMDGGPSWPFSSIVCGWFHAVSATIDPERRHQVQVEIFDRQGSLGLRLGRLFLKEALKGSFKPSAYYPLFCYIGSSNLLLVSLMFLLSVGIQLFVPKKDLVSGSKNTCQRPFRN